MDLKLILIASTALLLSSCSKGGWRVDGVIDNAPEDTKLAIEGFNGGRWYTIDSVEVKDDGSFAYVSPEGSPYPDIYRVSLGYKSIYFPIDSLEAITITADANDFDRKYTVQGWSAAQEMMRLDQRIAEVVADKGMQGAVTDSLLKRELSIAINDDANGILGYYLINKTIGDKPMFSTDDKGDLRILGSLANKFQTRYPNDPRTSFLVERYIRARSAMYPEAGRIVQANEAGFVDIELYDAHGVKRRLSDVAKEAGITLLSFTSYATEASVPYNVELNRLYEQYRPQRLAIYQVSLDPDEVQWRTSAANLPWTAVYYDSKDGGTLPLLYNLQVIPTTFVINGNGDLVERVDDPTKLEAAVKQHL